MAYAVSDGNFECDAVMRKGNNYCAHLRFVTRGKNVTNDVFQTIAFRELQKYWDIDDCTV